MFTTTNIIAGVVSVAAVFMLILATLNWKGGSYSALDS